jgi:hypothetical protein
VAEGIGPRVGPAWAERTFVVVFTLAVGMWVVWAIHRQDRLRAESLARPEPYMFRLQPVGQSSIVARGERAITSTKCVYVLNRAGETVAAACGNYSLTYEPVEGN